MKFLIDAQLPRELALWLREQGHDALHTLDLTDGNRTSDAEICRLADRDARIVVTKDADFVGSHQLQNTPAGSLSGLTDRSEGKSGWSQIFRSFEANSEPI